MTGTGGNAGKGGRGLRNWLMRAVSVCVDALYPRRCPVCGRIPAPGDAICCPSCFLKLSFVASPVCQKCGKEIISPDAEYCQDCIRRPRTFEYGIALLNYNEAAARSIAAIKYKNKREYLDFYGGLAAERCKKQLLGMKADGLIPVPIHPSRRRKRGFNQAELLAERMGQELGMPVFSEWLVRVKKTDPQKELGPSDRLKNLSGAFLADPEKRPSGVERVILVDDIYTTGSTMEACTRALHAAGIKKVFFFVLCIGQGR